MTATYMPAVEALPTLEQPPLALAAAAKAYAEGVFQAIFHDDIARRLQAAPETYKGARVRPVPLDLTRCLGLGDGALLSLAASPCAVKLEWLSFYADSHFSSKALGRVLASCGTSLTFLDLCGIAIEDSDLLRLLSTAKPELRSLNLTWCTALTDASLVPLLSSLPRLQWLSLHGNVSVTPAALHSLQRGCGDSIHTLDVRGCSAIPADMRQPDALKAKMPLLSVFVVHS